VYWRSSSTKELWKSLEKKYKIKEAWIKVSIISNLTGIIEHFLVAAIINKIIKKKTTFIMEWLQEKTQARW
jgi:hypothetical protein